MPKRIEKTVFLILVALVVISTHLYITFFTPASREGGARTVYIQKGTGFRMVAENLEKAGVVRDAESFIYAARLLGAYKKVQAGEYEFDRSMTPLEILNALTKGKVKKHLVTIPEGYNIQEVAEVLSEEGLADPGDFTAKATDRYFVATLGLEGRTLEGYLFPDTYSLTRGMTVEEIITKMVDKFKTVYTAEFDSAARAKGMSMRTVVTLASIIEKETGAPEERDLISAVFHNRLKNRIKLQSDPTVIYDIKDFDGNLTKKHLLAKTPYNTYVNYGLPPGPIANPGKASLKAAISPARADYLYFVSRNNGTHQFSSSLKDHNRAVDSFQRKHRTRSSPTAAASPKS
ncbi:MAG: endolytic transglycosylase MltG [Deltaproteobacteria bacterium]|nr:endolytic transglycosylase MltG [Deltaproteobacteria bacterium]